MSKTPIILSASSQSLRDNLKSLDCYDAYQLLNHPYSSKEVDTKHHILVTAMCLINEKGFDSLTMNHVVENSSVSRRTVYKYFTNKECLCSDIAILWAVYAQLSIKQNIQAEPLTLSGYIEAIIDFALECPEVLKAVSAGISYPSQHLADVYQDLEDQLIKAFTTLNQQNLAPRTQKQAKTAHKALVESLIYNLVLLAAKPDKKADVNRHLNDIIELFCV